LFFSIAHFTYKSDSGAAGNTTAAFLYDYILLLGAAWNNIFLPNLMARVCGSEGAARLVVGEKIVLMAEPDSSGMSPFITQQWERQVGIATHGWGRYSQVSFYLFFSPISEFRVRIYRWRKWSRVSNPGI
jgi:hypothetical protein